MTPLCITAPYLHLLSRDRAEWEPRGAIAVDEKGRILFAGPRTLLPERFHSLPTRDLFPDILLPGFVDLHSHLPQLHCRGRRVAGGGESGLLEWLNAVVFPEESRFVDAAYARSVARDFFRELALHGIATAVVYASSFLPAAQIAFEEAERSGLRIVMGRTLMDRNVPDPLRQDAAEALEGTRSLIEQWHGKNGLISYAVTPRFAASCSEELLAGCARLAEHHGTFVQTHINENRKEIDWVRRLFPTAGSYMSVYDRSGLLGRATLLAHNIHATDDELSLCARRGCAVVHCPDSNLFLESGRFPLSTYDELPIRLGLGCDIGAGTTVSMFNTMRAVERVQEQPLDPLRLLYLSTLGGAAALSMEQETGNFMPGKYFDAVCLSGTILPSTEDGSGITAERTGGAVLRDGEQRHVRRLFVRGNEIGIERP